MLATIVYANNPFDPARDRKVVTVGRKRRIDKLAPKTTQPFICLLNGAPILRKNKGWQKSIKDGDVVAFVILPQGGGGSNPLKVILMIGLAVFAPYAAGVLAPTLGVVSETGMLLLQAGIGFVGSTLINALIPPPKQPSSHSGQAGASASPTYNLAAQGNSARIGEAIPVIYGKHLIYPDFAAEPYTEYAGNEQYLYQLFCVGQGEYTITDLKIEDTAITNFAEVTYEVVNPGTKVTLFPANVITATEVAGQELLTAATIGPFVANPATTKTNALSIDIVAPRGIFYANDNGGLNSVSTSFKVEARAIDDFGVAVGGWTTLGTETISAATSTAIRNSYRYNVTKARYEVKVTRLDTKQTDSRYGHEIDWVSLRAYLPDSQDYGNLTLLAVRMRATNNISAQSARRINCIAYRKLPIWNGTSWSANTETRSIAWAFADALRASYGGNLPDSRIDLAQLLALHTTLSARGDHFDGIFDQKQVLWESVTSIARTGRAKPYVQGGTYHITRDGAVTLPVALFNQRNIVKGSLKVEYLLPSDTTSDSVIVTYFDEVKQKPLEINAALPGYSADNPFPTTLFGVTNSAQAWREGMYMAAANRLRRQAISFTTEMEGFIPTFGDLIAISHDRMQRSVSGDVLDYYIFTNLIKYARQFDNGVWIKSNCTVTVNSINDQNNELLADTINRTATGNHFIYQQYLTTSHANKSYTFSVWLKSGTMTGNVILRIRDGLSAELATKQITPTATWTRFSVTGTFGATPAANITVFIDPPNDVGIAGDTFYVSSASLTETSILTPFVNTAATPVTGYALKLSEPVVFTPYMSHYTAFKKRDGSYSGPWLTYIGDSYYDVVCAGPLDFTPDIDHMREKTSFTFGIGEEYRKLARVISVRPRSMNQVEIACINEDAAVHTADTGTVPPASSYWNLPAKITRPIVTGLNVTLSGTPSNPQLAIVWLPAAGADHYYVETSYDNASTWQRRGEVSSSNLLVTAQRGTVYVRVAGVGLSRGDWAEWVGDPYAVPPADVSSFLINVQPDGTRQFSMALPTGLPPDFAGYEIRYKSGTGSYTWNDLAPVHEGLITASPWESNQLDAGQYTFAIKAVDTSGNASLNANFIVADLADQRLAGVIYSILPRNYGWPGSKTNCFLESDTGNLVANDTATWSSLTTWSAWSQWPSIPASPITYQHSIIDLGAAVLFVPYITATADGTTTIQEQHSTDGITYSSWATAGPLINARYFRVRVSVAGILPILYSLNIQLSGNSLTEEINDLNTSTLTGAHRIGVGDIRIPFNKAFATITQAQITLQNVGAGWTVELIDKNATTGPRIKIYNASNTLADASIDAYLRGF